MLNKLSGLLTPKNIVVAIVIFLVVWLLYGGNMEGFNCTNDPKIGLNANLQPATSRDFENNHYYYNNSPHANYGPGLFEYDNTYYGGNPPSPRYIPDWYPYRHYPYKNTLKEGEELMHWDYHPNVKNNHSFIGKTHYKPCERQ